jgi:hypothetical protein
MKQGERKELAERAAEVLKPLGKWSHQCHAASLALVRAGIGSRVARGFCTGITGQHSWAVVGMDCYDPDAPVIDPTLWSWRKDVRGVYVGDRARYGHTPHGDASIWGWGKPVSKGGPVIELTPKTPLSESAEAFLELIGPLDRDGWFTLSHAPALGWPAGEIFAAMDDTEAVSHFVPVDMLGMLTERNPDGLYLPRPADLRKLARKKKQLVVPRENAGR